MIPINRCIPNDECGRMDESKTLCAIMSTMSDHDTRPHQDCCWIQEGRLLAGAYPGSTYFGDDRDLVEKHIQAGVSFFLDLTEENELVPYAAYLPKTHPVSGAPVVHRRMRMPDVETCGQHRDMNTILDTIDSALAAGHLVYVHCRYGIGRTGVAIGCYLVRHGKSGADAISELAKFWSVRGNGDCRWIIPETSEQRRYVMNWKPADTTVSGFRARG
jgi:protein-tyrosine phosphatase